jgi:tetratricopeptide (TPR) repeat protein
VLDANSANAFLNRGIIYMAKGDYDRAAQDFDRAVAIAPRALAFYNRAENYSRKKDYDRAREDYRRALAHNPDQSLKQDIEKSLNELSAKQSSGAEATQSKKASTQTDTQANSKASTQATNEPAQPAVVATFRRTSIEYVASNKSYLLRILPDNPTDGGKIVLQCYTEPKSIFVQLAAAEHVDAKSPASMQTISIWSDKLKPTDIRVLATDTMGVAMESTDDIPGAREAVRDVLKAVLSAQAVIGYRFKGKTISIAAKQISEAAHRFRDLCGSGGSLLAAR